MRGRSAFSVFILAVVITGAIAGPVSAAEATANNSTSTTAATTQTPTATPTPEPVTKRDVLRIVDQGNVSDERARTVYTWVTDHDLRELSDQEALRIYVWMLERTKTTDVPDRTLEDVTTRIDPAVARGVAQSTLENASDAQARSSLRDLAGADATWADDLDLEAGVSIQFSDDEPEESTSTNGSFSLQELRRGGREPRGTPPAPTFRMLPSGEYVGVKTYPTGPLAPEWSYLKTGQTLQDDKLSFYAARNGKADPLNLTLVVVYYTVEERQVQQDNETVVRRYATNQTVERKSVELGAGYTTTNVTLRSHYDAPVQMTMWLVDSDGEPIEGARWSALTHHTIPSSQDAGIGSDSELWMWAFWHVVGPGVVAVLLGLGLARTILKRAGRGPNKGLRWWGMVAMIVVFAIVILAWWQLAWILDHVPYVLGFVLFLPSFAAGMRFHPPVRWRLFERIEVSEAVPLRNAEKVREVDDDDIDEEDLEDDDRPSRYQESLYVDLVELPTIRDDDDNLKIPLPGFRPFFARLFADAAILDDTDLRTRIKARGKWAEKIMVDPGEEHILRLEPAHFEWDPSLFREPEESDPLVFDGEDDEQNRLGKLGLVNWTFVFGSLIALLAGHSIGGALGIGSWGVLGGVVVIALWSISAVDGRAEVVPAPIHMTSAQATLVDLQREYAEGRTLEEYEEIAWNERSKSALKTRESMQRMNQTVTEEVNRVAMGQGRANGGDDELRTTMETDGGDDRD